MNCQSCGGPLSETSGRMRMVCLYCGTINRPEFQEDSIDRVFVSGQVGEHFCPSCSVELFRAFVDETPVECCTRCSGILLARDVFVSVAWGRRALYQGAEETPQPVNQQELKEQRACPECQSVMDCHPYYGPGNTVVDACQQCDLIWLDVGELTTIERAPGQRVLRASS